MGNMHVLIANLGSAETVQADGSRIQRQIWLSITNASEYRAWNSRHNGIKRRSEGEKEGAFGAQTIVPAPCPGLHRAPKPHDMPLTHADHPLQARSTSLVRGFRPRGP